MRIHQTNFIATLLFVWLIPKCVVAKRSNDVTPRSIEIAIGGSANITCSSTDGDSTTMYFVEEDGDNAGRIVPQSDIVILDPYTIVYTIRNATEQDRKYKCMTTLYAMGLTHIQVGTPPLDVEAFKCRGYDYTYFVCNFTKPFNNVPVLYNVSYTAKAPFAKTYRHKNGTRFNRTIYSQNYKIICHLRMYERYGLCNLTLDPLLGDPYSRSYEYFNFSVVGYNVLGVNRQSFLINNYESVIPPRLEFKVLNLSTDHVVVTWTLINYAHYVEKGLEYEVMLRPDNFDWAKQTNYDILQNNASFKLVLRRLPYAYYWYTLRIRARVKSSRNSNTEWSELYQERFRTLSMWPEFSPATDVGSFYVGSSEPRVRLYWKQLPAYQENGAHFEYVISAVKRNGVLIDLAPQQIDRISAIFAWNSTSEYEFVVQSKNEVGLSRTMSKIVVPRMPANYERYEPKWIRNVYHSSNHSYSISWTPPDELDALIDYTIFYCPAKLANTNECQGSIKFQRLHKRSTTFSTGTHDKQYTLTFAVSANYADQNTGMHWTMCPVDGSSDLIKLEPEYTTPNNGTILAQWSVERLCNSLTEGYNLTYCEVDLHRELIDKELGCITRNFTLPVDKMATRFILGGLKPYTTYKLQIYMYSKVKIGQISDAQYVTTKEEAPTSPLSLKFLNVTNNAVWILWKPPALLNGRLRHYRIFYNDGYRDLHCSIDPTKSICNDVEIRYKLEHLRSYTNYVVTVSAFTVAYSERSEAISFKTNIGVPSNPRHVIGVNNDRLIQWTEPEVPAGRLEFYEVNFAVWNADEIERQSISIVMDAKSCLINVPTCLDSNYKYTIQIRAINVAVRNNETAETTSNVGDENSTAYYLYKDEELRCVNTAVSGREQMERYNRYSNTTNYVLFKSDWENGPRYGCAAGKKDTIWAAIILILMIIFVIGIFIYGGFRKIHHMWNLKITLPEGLNSTEPFNSENEKLYHNYEPYRTNLKSSITSDNYNIYRNNIAPTNSTSIDRSSGYESSHKSEDDNTNDDAATYMVMQKAIPLQDDYTRMSTIKVPHSNYVNPTTLGTDATSNSCYINNWSRLFTIAETQAMNATPTVLPATTTEPCITTGGGYVSVDDIGNIAAAAHDLKTLPPPSTITSPKHSHDKHFHPSGYVTQFRLSADNYHQTTFNNS